MENVKLTLPNGLTLEAGRMSPDEAKEFDGKVPVPDAVVSCLAESVGILAQTHAILAIRLVRGVLGMGLRDAKAFMERERAVRAEEVARMQDTQRRAEAAAEADRMRRIDAEERQREDEEAARNGDIPF